MSEQNERNSKIDYLRVVLMLLIIAHHYGVHGGAINSDIDINKIISRLFSGAGQVGVCVFFILSGYFYDKYRFNILKILKLMFIVWIYNIGIYLFCLLMGHGFLVNEFFENLFPIISRRYNFATCWCVLYFCQPFLIRLFNALTARGRKVLLFLGIICSSVVPSFFFSDSFVTIYPLYIFLFYLGAFIKKTNIKAYSNMFTMSKAIATYLLTISLALILDFYFGTDALFYQHLTNTNFLSIIYISVCLTFWGINNNDSYFSKANILRKWGGGAKLVWGIFLIHDNSYMRYYIWSALLQVQTFSNVPSAIFVIHNVLSICIVFIACGAIEYLRQIIFNHISLKINNDRYISILKLTFIDSVMNDI